METIKSVYDKEQAYKKSKAVLAEQFKVEELDIEGYRVTVYTEHATCSYWANDKETIVKPTCRGEGPDTVEEFQAAKEAFKADKQKILKVVEAWKKEFNDEEPVTK